MHGEEQQIPGAEELARDPAMDDRRPAPSATGAIARNPLTDPRVGWIYDIRKEDLKREMARHGLSIAGSSRQLRQRFVDFWKHPSSPFKVPEGQRPPLSRPGAFPAPLAGIPETGALDSPDAVDESIRGLARELASVRQILGLSPNADSMTVRRALTSVVQTAGSATPSEEDRRTADYHPESDGLGRGRVERDRPHPVSGEDPGKTLPPRARGREDEPSAASVCNQARKWNLKFDGNKDPIAFVERLEELMDAYSLEPDHILKALPELLQGSALLWYRNSRGSWRDYQGFRRLFDLYFFPPGYHRDLEEEIRKRTQGEHESFRDYVVALSTLVRRSGCMSEHSKLELLYKNTRPEYKLMVRRNDFHSLGELIERAEDYEAYVREKLSFRPPPSPEMALIPETAYSPKGRASRKPYHTAVVGPATPSSQRTPGSRADVQPAQAQTRAARSPATTAPSTRRPAGEATVERGGGTVPSPSGPPCWNCDAPGHFARECPRPQAVRCFRCKKRGFTSAQCGCRAGNGSLPREVRGHPSAEHPTRRRPQQNGSNGSAQ